MADTVDHSHTKLVYAGNLVAQRTKQAREAQNMLISALKNPDQQVATKRVATGKLAARRTKQAREAQNTLFSALKNPAMIQMVIRLLDEVPNAGTLLGN